MGTEKMQMHTNARLVAKVLTKYRDTFYALKELINNSLYAKATLIDINFIPSEGDRDCVFYHPIDKIQIRDNGYGVSYTDFKKSIMEIATDNKSDGYGVGRFSALQIGRCMHISTTAYDETSKQYTKTEVDFDIRQFQKDDLQSKDFDVKVSVAEDSHDTGYQVEIRELYTYDEKCKRKNKLGKEFTNEGFPQKLFESYPIYIFEGKVKFYFNGIELKRTDFTTENPSIKKTSYTDIQGRTHNVIFKYYSLKLKDPKVRLFLQCFDGNINYTALELTYNSNWYAPSLGTQYVLIESDYLTRDFCDNYELVHLNNKEWVSFSTFLKKEIDEHYKKDNAKYKRFLEKLQNDKSYPFTIKEIESNSLSVDLFNQSAFIIEDDLKILETGTNKSLIYTLLRKVIDDGNISFIIEHVMGLSSDSKAKLIELLDKTNLEAVVNYTSSLAKMEQTLEMLNKITVCEVDKHTEQFADISVLLSRNMWLFGEQYMRTIAIEPEEDICRVLDKLFKMYISYKPQPKKYDNQIEECKRKVKSLSSMAFYSERKLTGNEKDILCVVMLAPSIKANQYDLAQIDNYIYHLEKDNTIVKEGVRFRIYFMVSMLADFAKSQINFSSTNDRELFLYKCRNQNGNDIKAYLLEWKQLVKYNKELLAYASSSLKLNKFDVEAAFMQEYSDLIEKKSTAQLHIVKW